MLCPWRYSLVPASDGNSGSVEFEVEAAVSNTLPMDVLLGTDVAGLTTLLGQESTENDEEAMSVMTRAQQKRHSREEEVRRQKEIQSGARPNTMEDAEDDFQWAQGLSDELFPEERKDKPQQTRSQKRQERHRHRSHRSHRSFPSE